MFEYKVEKFKTSGFFGGNIDQSQLTEKLAILGLEGWELVTSFASNETYGSTKYIVLIFKRYKN